MASLLPVPARLPRRAWIVFGALLASAWGLLLPASALPGGFPGDPTQPYAAVTLNLHWQLHARGMASLVADDLHGFPLRTDRLVTDGLPVDALASWPLAALFGEATGMWLWALVTLWAVGAAAAWLGMRWWGTLGAGLVAGLGYQVGEGLLREVAEGRPTQAFAAIFLPLALGLGVEAARCSWGGGLLGGNPPSRSLWRNRSPGAGGPRRGADKGGPVGAPLWGGTGLGPWPRFSVPRAGGDGRGDFSTGSTPPPGGARPPLDPPGPRGGRSSGTVAAVGAGMAAAIGTLASWNLGPVFALAAFGPLVGAVAIGAWRGHRARGEQGGATLLAGLAAAGALLLPAIAWTLTGRNELPSFGMDPWQETVLRLRQVRPVDLAAARIHGLDGVAVGTLARPVLLLAAAWTAWRARTRHVGVPLAFACLLAIVGLGSWLPGPVVLPWGWLQALPGAGRLWWPDRAWIGVALGLAVLAAGAPRRAVWLVGLGILAEAWLLSRALPFDRVPLGPSPSAQVLARAPDVPFVLLPTGQGPFREDRLDLVDQLQHGRPMANGTRAVLDLTSSDAVLRNWRNNAGLRALLACEMGGGAQSDPSDAAAVTAALTHAGLRDVYVDPRYVEGDPTYAKCVEGVLAGWERREEPPLVRFRAP